MVEAVDKSSGHWLLLALAPACVVALIVLGAFVEPAIGGHGTHTQFGLPECRMMSAFGVPCPGCGVTTSVALAAHGRVLAALANQPLGVVVALGLALYPVWVLQALARGRDLARELQRCSPRFWMASAALLVGGSWVYKLVTGFEA